MVGISEQGQNMRNLISMVFTETAISRSQSLTLPASDLNKIWTLLIPSLKNLIILYVSGNDQIILTNFNLIGSCELKLWKVASFIFYHVGYAPGPEKLPKNVLFPIIDRKVAREYEECKIENTEEICLNK